MDQQTVVGVGNIYADEALWRSRLHPLRSARSLRPADERALYRNIREILAEAVERRGGSVEVVGSGPILPLVAAALVEHGLVPHDLHAEQPTLEDAFLALVGVEE